MGREVDIVITCCEVHSPRAIEQIRTQSGFALPQVPTPRGCLVDVFCDTVRHPLTSELDTLVEAFKNAAFFGPQLATLTLKSDDGTFDLRIGGDE